MSVVRPDSRCSIGKAGGPAHAAEAALRPAKGGEGRGHTHTEASAAGSTAGTSSVPEVSGCLHAAVTSCIGPHVHRALVH